VRRYNLGVDMPIFTELARAKINLTLNVLGRRPDGYHELESLVAFADIGDIITLDTDAPVGAADRVSVSGPFATALAGENLIATTLQRLAAACPALRLGTVHLEKRLPVAAGIGGGSADAAAVIRAVRRANADLSAAQTLPWTDIAASLGADVPACLANQAAWMRGVGERLEPLPGLPRFHAVLVNALGEVPPDKTSRVFRALNAPPIQPDAGRNAGPPAHLRRLCAERTATDGGGASAVEAEQALLEFMLSRGNDLETATRLVVPDVGLVLNRLRKALAAQPAAQSLAAQSLVAQSVVTMSGAGPTCFGLVGTAASARAVAASIRQSQPSWWVVASEIV
jgi:4-diphosphocytidyl-2-C-methyl-D-erythritol kinase